MKSIWLVVLSVIFCGSINAQVHDHDHDHDHDHHHDHNHDHDHEVENHLYKYHFGLATAPVYFLDDKTNSFAIHTHILRMLGEGKLGLGVSYERIFNDRMLNTYGLIAAYKITNDWIINATPGLSFRKMEEVDFAFHLETSYEFQIHAFHLGPFLQFAHDPDDTRLGLGLHLGYSWD